MDASCCSNLKQQEAFYHMSIEQGRAIFEKYNCRFAQLGKNNPGFSGSNFLRKTLDLSS